MQVNHPRGSRNLGPPLKIRIFLKRSGRFHFESMTLKALVLGFLMNMMAITAVSEFRMSIVGIDIR